MQKYLLSFLVLFGFLLYAQPNTEVHLLDFVESENTFTLKNIRNISNNEGYDNQPHFHNEDILLFASTRDQQTDIKSYDLRSKTYSWISNTPEGSEYSPLNIPETEDISAIRLDKDGLQRLYAYDFQKGTSELLIKDLKVGYHVWIHKKLLVATILVEEGMDLIAYDLDQEKYKVLARRVGRSLHKIPNSNLISYVDKSSERTKLKSIDPIKGIKNDITELMEGVEDLVWTPKGSLLCAQKNQIYVFENENKKWNSFSYFMEDDLFSISRMAISPDGKNLAIVSEVSPEITVQKQLDAYNRRDIEAFAKTFAKNVEVYNFPEELVYTGIEKLKERYADFFERTPDLNSTIQKRMVFDNKVIDEELLTVNGKKKKIIAIYEVKNGKIIKATFMR